MMYSDLKKYETVGNLVRYYEKKLDDSQISIYVQALSDVPDDLLHQAAVEWIKTGKWFPKVSELRELAEKQANIAPRHSFSSYQEPGYMEDLYAEELALRERYYHDDIFSQHEWENMIRRYQAAGCLARAEGMQMRLDYILGRRVDLSGNILAEFFKSILSDAEVEQITA